MSKWELVKRKVRGNLFAKKFLSATAEDKMTNNATPVILTLGNAELVFEEGEWHVEGSNGEEGAGGGRRAYKEVVDLRKENQDLREHVRLMEFKVQLLLDMLALSNLDLMTYEKRFGVLEDENDRGPSGR